MHKNQNNPKTSKNEKNERCKKFNPHASISTLCLIFYKQFCFLECNTYNNVICYTVDRK